MTPSDPTLVVQNLRLGHATQKKRDYTLACDDLSFQVERGEFIAIVGPSGCGKTTFLSAVAGLLPIASGRLELDGRQIDGPGPERSLVFQQASLFPWRTVRRNIEFSLEAEGKKTADSEQRVRDMITLVGLDGADDKFPGELSGGMSQRVNLARALVTDPDLLLLDEPFAALDAQTREVMQQELTRIWQAGAGSVGKTAIFITHDVPEAVLLADRVIVFSAGPAHLVESVTVDLPRPRDVALKRDRRFLELVDYVLGRVMEQFPGARRAS
jgi:NitT/TauT family transport system ATP-binding protein